jgi:hypothetical protein
MVLVSGEWGDMGLTGMLLLSGAAVFIVFCNS